MSDMLWKRDNTMITQYILFWWTLTSDSEKNRSYRIRQLFWSTCHGHISSICCVLFIVMTIRSFPHSWFITGFVTTVTRWVPLVEQKLFSTPEHLSSHPVFSGVRVAQFIIFCVVVLRSLFALLFVLVIVLSVLRFMTSGYPFGFFKLFSHNLSRASLVYMLCIMHVHFNFETNSTTIPLTLPTLKWLVFFSFGCYIFLSVSCDQWYLCLIVHVWLCLQFSLRFI